MKSVVSINEIHTSEIAKVGNFIPFSGRGYILGSLHPVRIDIEPPKEYKLEQNESQAKHFFGKA